MPKKHNAPETVDPFASKSIQEAIEDHPEILPVLYNHLGASCFDCPGRFEETLEKGIRLHEADPEIVLRDLRRNLKSE